MNAESHTVRLFLALPLPDPVVRLLQYAQQALQSRLAGPWVKWVHPEHMHLTLKFLGDVPSHRIQALVSTLTQSPPASPPLPLLLRSGQAGCFPHPKRPRVLWLGVEGDVAPLRLVQAWIEHKTVGFGGAPDERAFTPHLTLGRTPPHLQPNESRAVGESLEKLTGLERVSWPAAHYELIQSELRKTGAIHHTLQQFPLPESASCGLRE